MTNQIRYSTNLDEDENELGSFLEGQKNDKKNLASNAGSRPKSLAEKA